MKNCSGKGSTLEKIAWALVIIGALNWLLVGIFNWDLVAWIFGKVMVLGRIVYILVGLSGIYLLASCCSCSKDKAACGACEDGTCGDHAQDDMMDEEDGMDTMMEEPEAEEEPAYSEESSVSEEGEEEGQM